MRRSTIVFVGVVLSVGVASGQFCFPGESSRFRADPTNCTRFFRCVFGNAQFFQCAGGRSWNEERQFCDFGFNPNCPQGTGVVTQRPRPPIGGGGGRRTRVPPFIGVTPPQITRRPRRITTRRPPRRPRRTTMRTTTTSRPTFGNNRLPEKMIAFYLPMADENIAGFGSRDDWTPQLFPFQQRDANVFIFTFINPITLTVPRSFITLAQTRGTNQPGAVPKDAKILFSIGGFSYSKTINPWPFLASRRGAEAAAREVS